MSELLVELNKTLLVLKEELKDRDEIIKELHRVNSLLKIRLHEYESNIISTDELD